MTDRVIPFRSELVRSQQATGPGEDTAVLGVAIGCGAWAMTLGALAFAYAFLHGRGLTVPRELIRQIQLCAWTGNLLLGGAWWALSRLLAAVRGGHRPSAWVAGQVALTSVAALITEGRLFCEVVRAGTSGPASAALAAVVALLAFHAVHLAVGTVGIGMVLWRLLGGGAMPVRVLSLRLWSIYWAFLVGGWWALTPLWGTP